MRYFTGALLCCLALITFFAKPNQIIAADSAKPIVKVKSVRRLFHNGEHNAFTDMCKFKGKYYLTFRSCPDGHMVHPTSSIIILSSDDTKTWKQVYRFSVKLRDVRDSHFLVFKDKLFVYTGTWYCGKTSPKTRDMNELLGYGVWSDDGEKWSDPIMLEGTYGHYVWRAATYNGKAYLCGRRKKEFAKVANRAERDPLVESAILESDDGLIWKTAGLFQKEYGDETAFLIEPDGTALAIARCGSGRNAQICRSQYPFKTWKRKNLDRYIGGPLVVKWGNRYMVGGRKTLTGKAVTSLCWLVDDSLHEFAELPSGGDNSYPGFLELSPKKGIVSYYSSHEKDDNGKTITAIYMAELEIE